jgi:hypothetical protein
MPGTAVRTCTYPCVLMSSQKRRAPDTAHGPKDSRGTSDPSVPPIAAFLGFVMGDDLGMVIRSHMSLEIGLNQLLVDVAPEGSELDRLPFLAKVDVCVALHRLLPELRPGFVIVNRIRNRFAHDLQASITDLDARDLMAAIPSSLKETGATILAAAGPPRHRVAFGFLVLYLCLIPRSNRAEAVERYVQEYPDLVATAQDAARGKRTADGR